MLEFLQSWKAAVLAAVLAVVASLSFSLYVEHSRLVAEKSAHQLDILKYTAEQDKYKAEALEAKAAKEKAHNEDTQKADAGYAALYSKYVDSLRNYKASRGQVGRSDLPGNADTSEGPDGPSESPEGVYFSYEDADTCAVNTARLRAGHDWAVSDTFKQ